MKKPVFPMFLYVVTTLILSIKSSNASLVLTQNHEEITVNQGDEASLICSANVEALGCSFRSPTGKPYNLLKGAR